MSIGGGASEMWLAKQCCLFGANTRLQSLSWNIPTRCTGSLLSDRMGDCIVDKGVGIKWARWRRVCTISLLALAAWFTIVSVGTDMNDMTFMNGGRCSRYFSPSFI